MASPLHTGGSTAGVSVTNASTVLLAANTTRTRRFVSIANRKLNTLGLYVNFSDTVPTILLYDYYVAPGQSISDNRQQPYQGIVRGILDGAGPETVNVNDGTGA